MIPVFLYFTLAKPKIADKEDTFSFVQMYDGVPEIELVCKVEEANPYQMNFTWQAQLSGCTNTDCKPNNSNWQTVTGGEIGLKIVSDAGKSKLILEHSEQHFFYRCTAENAVGEDSRVWKVVPVRGNVLTKLYSTLRHFQAISTHCSGSLFCFTVRPPSALAQTARNTEFFWNYFFREYFCLMF
jgi:hypothetical protein